MHIEIVSFGNDDTVKVIVLSKLQEVLAASNAWAREGRTKVRPSLNFIIERKAGRYKVDLASYGKSKIRGTPLLSAPNEVLLSY